MRNDAQSPGRGVFGFIPVGALADGKSRMTPLLGGDERGRLVLAMLRSGTGQPRGRSSSCRTHGSAAD